MVKWFSNLLKKPPGALQTQKENIIPWYKRLWRLVVDVVMGFINDDCYAKASALTFYSLLSIVPVFAVLFGIAKGFGFEQALESEISNKFFDQPEVTSRLIQFAYSWLQSVKGGLIAGVGTIVLLWSVIGLLNNIENALNAIWKIKTGRSYTRKISDYLAVLVIAPLFFVASSGTNIFLTTRIEESAHSNIFVEAIGPVLLFLLKLFPYFLAWVLFTYIYLFMPNTKVYLRTALIAGIIAGSAFQIWQWLYIKFQIGVASYGAIYGSFAALPLFLIWLQISWLIVLAGAELAVQLENDLFVPNRVLHPLSTKAAALLITLRCTQAFARGEPPLTDRQLAGELGLSLNHLHTLVEALINHRILSEASFANKTFGYQPAQAIHHITIKMVCDALDKSSEIPACVQDTKELEKIEEIIEGINEALAKSPVNKPVYSI